MQATHSTQNASLMTEAERRRLSWRCRRGLLELDIVLQRFAEDYLADLNAAELTAFDRLLEYPDNELLDVVTGKMQLVNDLKTDAMQTLINKLNPINSIV